MDFEYPLDNHVKKITKQKFLRKTSYKNQFQIIWKFAAPYITDSHEKIGKKINLSILWREIGNKIYTTSKNEGDHIKAIEAYTTSIAHAPVGSSELSLAYANRSAVLYKARLYNDCLVDIERALKLSYPDHLKTKLYVRQALCYKSLKPDSDVESNASMASAMQWLPDCIKVNPKYNIINEYPKLMKELGKPREIFEFIPKIENPNSIIVGASDAIELKKNNGNNQQHVFATRDIKSGEFIYINEAFAASISDGIRFLNCWHCCRRTWSSVPCDNCPNVIYCSDECKKKSWDSYHSIECLVLGDILKFADDNKNSNNYNFLIIKIISKALKKFGNLINWKKKIDEIDSIYDKTMITTNCKLDVNTLDNFHRLDFIKTLPDECKFNFSYVVVFIVAVFGVNTNILGNKMSLKELIKSKNENILIMGELVWRYLLITYSNSPSFCGKNEKWSNVVLPISNIFKKSCDPNTEWSHFNTVFGYYACKPIKQGESIFVSSAGSYHINSKTSRHMKFNAAAITCKCSACVNNWQSIPFLPSYTNMSLPMNIRKELDSMTLELNIWQSVIERGDTKKLLEIKDTLSDYNDKFHQYITVPYKQKSLSYESYKYLHGQLRTGHNIF